MKKGFTLVELAMVLIVVGLLMGGAFQMMKVMQEKARATEAKQTLESTKNAIITFAINNNRLPTAGEFTGMNLIGAGNIPIYYDSDTALQTDLCGQTTTLLNTTDFNGVTTPNIGFVLAVAGENMQMQTARTGTNITFPQWNTMTAGFPYDDLHTQVTLGELQSAVECKPLSIINPMLPTGMVGLAYSINPIIVATGGTQPYTYQRSGALPAGITYNNNAFSGTPTASGSFPLTFTVTDSIGATATRQLVLVINADPNAGGTGNNGGGNGNNGNGGGNGNGNNGNGNGNGNGGGN
jgi:prepilin-type N-terminal cleavage/methylation domain-containing protein